MHLELTDILWLEEIGPLVELESREDPQKRHWLPMMQQPKA